jgi:L-ascorbate metabolism protein UlaG (beta-lactamase superfamily)
MIESRTATIFAPIRVFDFVTSMPQTQLTWYDQSAFKITTPAGNIVLVDPWLTNPVFEKGKHEVAALKRCDLILRKRRIQPADAIRSN